MRFLPCIHWSIYVNGQTGNREFCIWRQWFRRAYDIRRFVVG